jgi:hypothetical protein
VILHITNGGSAGNTLQSLFPADRVLPWRDVLHDGPVPAGLALAELSARRAEFLAARGWAAPEEVRAQFEARDAALREPWDEIVLWFEHDLYDQLQLIQVIAELNGDPRVRLIQSDQYLGELPLEAFRVLFSRRTPLAEEQSLQAAAAWNAFRDANPAALPRLATPALPYLAPALRRFCQEYPWLEDHCSLTERIILRAVLAGYVERHRLFEEYLRFEEPKWMGDSAFFSILESLQAAPAPLLTKDNRITAHGIEVLQGRAFRGGVDRWMGGVHLHGPRPPWLWDERNSALIPTPA